MILPNPGQREKTAPKNMEMTSKQPTREMVFCGRLFRHKTLGGPKTQFGSPCVFSLFNDRTADGRKHNAKLGRPKFQEKSMHFCDVHFSLAEKQILRHYEPNNMHCWSIHFVFYLGFSKVHTLMFFDPSKRALKPRKGIEINVQPRSHVEISIPRTPPKGTHSDGKGGPKRRPFRVLRDEKRAQG